MSKVSLPRIESGYLSVEVLNSIFDQIEVAFDNTLSRDGDVPNQMEADLDLNGNNLLNSGESDDPNRVVSFTEMNEFVGQHSSGIVVQHMETQISGASQTVFVLDDFEYAVGSNNLAVYVDGVRVFTPSDYTETSSTSITFLVGLTIGKEVTFVINEYLGTIALQSHTHPWSQITNTPAFTTRWPDWTEVTGKPTTFTPAAHVHDAADITTGRLADARRGVFVQASQPASPQTGDLWFW